MKKFLEKIKNISATTRNVAIATGVSVSALATTLPVFAAETLDPAITSGFTSAAATVALVIGLGIGACVGCVALSGGGKAALKWIKGVFAHA